MSLLKHAALSWTWPIAESSGLRPAEVQKEQTEDRKVRRNNQCKLKDRGIGTKTNKGQNTMIWACFKESIKKMGSQSRF